MDIDQLKTAWQRRPVDPSEGDGTAQSAAAIGRRLERIRRAAAWRDGVETGSAVAGILVFGSLCWILHGALAKGGAALIAGGLALIVVKLRRGRRGDHGSRADTTVSQFCAEQLADIDRQIALLRSVIWWYLAPVVAGANLFYVGVGGFNRGSLTYFMVTLLVAVAVWWLNVRTVRHTLLPVRQALAALVDDLRREER